VRWRAEKVSGLLQRFIFCERQHHDRLVAIAGDDDWCVIFTHAIDGGGEIFPRSRVGDRLHGGQDTVQLEDCQIGLSEALRKRPGAQLRKLSQASAQDLASNYKQSLFAVDPNVRPRNRWLATAKRKSRRLSFLKPH